MSNKSQISVIIPAYNAEAFLETTLNSVFNQTLIPFEVIVIDDGSTDNTASIAKNFDVKYAYQKNQGTAGALNHGISLASGDIFAFLDHDDIWLPKKLQHQYEVIRKFPSIDMVFTLMENVIVNKNLAKTLDVDMGPMNGVHKSTFMVKKSSFFEVGKFSIDCLTQEFLNWFALALDKGLKAQTVQEILVKRTIHGTNQTLLNKEMKNDFPKVIKAILDRRRQGNLDS